MTKINQSAPGKKNMTKGKIGNQGKLGKGKGKFQGKGKPSWRPGQGTAVKRKFGWGKAGKKTTTKPKVTDAAQSDEEESRNRVTSAGLYRELYFAKRKLDPGPRRVEKCLVCNVESGIKKINVHYNTDLHKELVEVRQHWLWEGRFDKTLDEQIEKRGADLPIVGLQHIRQYEPDEKDEKSEYTYECKLCQEVCRPRAVLYHVLSIPHRILYLSRQHKSMGIDKDFEVTTREEYQLLVTCTAKAAQIDGKRTIKVMNTSYADKPEEPEAKKKKKKKKDDDSLTKIGPTGIGMDIINEALASVGANVSSEGSVPSKPVDVARKSAQKSPDVAKDPMSQFKAKMAAAPRGGRYGNKQEDILELLTAFLDARSQVDQADTTKKRADDVRKPVSKPMPKNPIIFQSSRPSTMPTTAQPILPEHNTVMRRPVVTKPFTKGDPGKSFKELKAAHEAKTEAGESEDLKSGSVEEQDPREYNPDYFWCNDELYDFLGDLAVENKEDVGYVLKVTEIFANSLVRHKQRTDSIKQRILQEKEKLEKEKKAFLSAPGVNKALKQKEQKEKEEKEQKEREQKEREQKEREQKEREQAAAKRRASSNFSSSNKPLFPISSPVNLEPPSKAKRLLSQSFDSYRPSAQARNTTPPRQLSQSRAGKRPFGGAVNRSQGRAGNTSPQRRQSGPQFNQAGRAPGNTSPQRRQSGPQFNQAGRGAENTSPQRRQSGPQFNQGRPSDQRPSFGQSSNRPQANANPQRMQGSQFNQSESSYIPKQDFVQTANKPQGFAGYYTGPSTGNSNPQQRMQGNQFSQSGTSDERPGFGQDSNRPQGYSGPSANANPSQQRMSGTQFSQSGPSDQRSTFGQTSNRPQGYNTGPSSANANPSQQRMQGSQFSQSGPSSGQRPGFGQTSNRPQDYYTGPSTNPSQQRMSGPQFGQSGPSSDPKSAFGQTSNRPQGPATSNTNPSQQRMSGPQFNQSRPTSDSRQGFGSQGSESRFQQSQNSFEPRGNSQGFGTRAPFSESRPTSNQPRQPTREERPTSYPQRPAFGEQKQPSDQSRTQMNVTRQPFHEQRQPLDRSWTSPTDSRNPANARPNEAKQMNRPRALMAEDQMESRSDTDSSLNDSRSSWSEKRQSLNDSDQIFKKPEPPVNESRSSWSGQRPEMESGPPVPQSRQSWQEQRPIKGSSASANDSTFESRPSWQGQRMPSNDQYPTLNKPRSRFSDQPNPSFNESRPSFNQAKPPNEQRPSLNQSRPPYGASGRYADSDASYKEDDSVTGYDGGQRSSYGPGAEGPGDPNAYYKESEKFTGSQYGNTGSTGGARQSYGAGAGRQGEGESYYTENERYPSSQYGNSGAPGGARQSYGPGAGRPEGSDAFYKENEKFTGSQYGNTGPTGGAKPAYGSGPTGGAKPTHGFVPAAGAKPAYGSGAGAHEGSGDSYSYNQQYDSSHDLQYPLKYSSSSYSTPTTGSMDPQNSQHNTSMGSTYGGNQGNWSNQTPQRSDTYPSKGPGGNAADLQQQPYSSNQGTPTFNESWK